MSTKVAKPSKERKPAKQEPAKPVNKARHMNLVLQEGQTRDRALAESALSPEVANASTVADYSQRFFAEICLQDCIEVMQADIKAVNGGNLDKLEGMLTGQAEALNVMFNNFAKRAIQADVMPRLEAYFRLALKAQAQCRATVETIAEIKYPKSATFIRQANIAQQQQVNNGVASNANNTRAPAHAHEKTINPTNELLEAQHGERLDSGATGTAGRIDSDMATVGAVNRTKDRSREGSQ